MKIEITQEQVNNLFALLNRVQLTGAEAEVVVELKNTLRTSVSVEKEQK